MDLRACGELDINNYSRNRFELIRREPLRRLYAFPVSDKISAYIFTAVLAGFFSSLGLLHFYFHITIASDGASATNIEYLLLKLNVKTSNFIESNFRFFCNLQHIQEILLRAESCLCPDPKAWGLVIVIYMKL
jgi:hypothetical protein